jgi:protein-disulfide isomerase
MVVTAMTIWLLLRPATTPIDEQASTEPAQQHETEPTAATSSTEVGPPWRYGRPDARYTIIEYADLECPFCRSYFPILKRWIDAHPEVNWQWHHLPLAIHEPEATAGARLVECVGAAGGQAAFWQALKWVYANTRGNGQGLPEGLTYPDITPAAKQCLASDRPDALIHAQAEEAAQNGVSVTPALRLRDRERASPCC